MLTQLFLHRKVGEADYAGYAPLDPQFASSTGKVSLDWALSARIFYFTLERKETKILADLCFGQHSPLQLATDLLSTPAVQRRDKQLVESFTLYKRAKVEMFNLGQGRWEVKCPFLKASLLTRCSTLVGPLTGDTSLL